MNDEPEPHYEDLRVSNEDWEDEKEEEERREEDAAYSTASATESGVVSPMASLPAVITSTKTELQGPRIELQTAEIKPQPPVAKSRIQSMPLDFNMLSHNAGAASLEVLRAKSPMLTATNVPLVRQSVDGEYVLPNEAYDGGLLSPTREEGLPDYIDIA